MKTNLISLSYVVLYFLSVVISSCQEYQSCSSLQTNFFDSKEFTRTCILNFDEAFIFHFPLDYYVQSPQKSLQFAFTLINSQTSLKFKIIRLPKNNEYSLELHHDSSTQESIITTDLEYFEVSINQGVYSVHFGNQKFSGELDSTDNSILAINYQNIENATEQRLPSIENSSFRHLFQCPSGSLLIDGICIRVCPINSFKHDNLCLRCKEGCNGCISATQCNPCEDKSIYFQEEDVCVSQCPPTYFHDFNNRVCVKCLEGCTKCSFPTGSCVSTTFEKDMVINLFICLLMVSFVTLCACYCNKDRNEKLPQSEEKAKTQEKDSQKAPPSPKLKKNSLAGPYNVLAEELNYPENEEDEAIPSRRKQKRLSNYARSRLLSLSMAKSFQVDDGNEEKAISHDSTIKIISTANSPMLVGSKIESSPALKSRSPLLSQYAESKYMLRSLLMTEDLEKQENKTQSNYIKQRKEQLRPNLESTLQVSNQTSLGLIGIKLEELDGVNTPQLKTQKNLEEDEKEDKGNISKLEISDIIHEEGYKSNFSLSHENDENSNHVTCTICGLNKRNCINQPCKHTIACYACMEQFRKDYGVCPRCQKFLTGLEKNKNVY